MRRLQILVRIRLGYQVLNSSSLTVGCSCMQGWHVVAVDNVPSRPSVIERHHDTHMA